MQYEVCVNEKYEYRPSFYKRIKKVKTVLKRLETEEGDIVLSKTQARALFNYSLPDDHIDYSRLVLPDGTGGSWVTWLKRKQEQQDKKI